jgi:hypothetical protein
MHVGKGLPASLILENVERNFIKICLFHELQYAELKLVDPDSQENIRAANATVATFHAKLCDVVVRVVGCITAPV